MTVALLTGCADDSRGIEALTEESPFDTFSEESVSDITDESGSDALPIELPEYVTIYHKDNSDENGDPVLECRPDGYYAYNGRRYWVDTESGTGCFVEENGSYALVPDQFGELMPEDRLFGVDKIMYYFNAEDYLYLGRSETENNQPEFYVHKDGKHILRIYTDDDVLTYNSFPQEMLGEGRTPVMISVLVASKI